VTTTEGQRATYKERYEPDDNGLRFQDLVYTGNFTGMEPVPDGILGDKMLKSRAKSKVLEKVSKEDVLRGQFTIDELNDLNNYLAWNIWDVLVMRATEGVSGMIPRQEYEILAFMHEFYRWPEILRMTTDAVGAQGIMDIGATARREIGTKVNCVHDWCIGAVGFGMGRCGLLALEVIAPDDYIEESNEILKFMQRVLWGKRQDGYILNSQDRYRCRIHEPDFLQTIVDQVEPLEPGSPRHEHFTQFNAAAELLAFLDHYDCRLGWTRCWTRSAGTIPGSAATGSGSRRPWAPSTKAGTSWFPRPPRTRCTPSGSSSTRTCCGPSAGSAENDRRLHPDLHRS
jgi:hypothetical protein